MTKQTALVSKAGRPKDQAKRKAVLEAAKHLFLSKGYDGSSMDAIAAQAGVSKLTVYNHFRDKATLFSAAITAKCDEQLPERLFEFSAHASLQSLLHDIGIKYLQLICSSEAVALQRVIVTMANQEPKLACMFYQAGARHMLGEMAELLRRASLAGRLQLDDPHRAAERFFCLLKGDDYFRVLIGVCQPLEGEEAAIHVREVVTVFMTLYGVERAGGRTLLRFSPLVDVSGVYVPGSARVPAR